MICSYTEFHPVGQGLFSSGCIYGAHYDNELSGFDWIFDCGSHSKGHPNPEVISYARSRRMAPVDMFCISHFDEDHVNGAKTLLRCCGAKTIVLPYLTLSQRMTLALVQNAKGTYFRFLVDPASYVLSLAGPGARIFFIRGGGGTIEGLQVTINDRPPGDEDNGGGSSDIPHDFRVNPEVYGVFQNSSAGARTFVYPDSTAFQITIGPNPLVTNTVSKTIWEFCFYNWDQSKKIPSSIHQDLMNILNKNRVGPHRFSKQTLSKIRAYYAQHFGAGNPVLLEGYNANQISLAMYSGPVNVVPIRLYPSDSVLHYGSNLSLLMTGDIYFKNAKRLNAAKTHFTQSRWDQIGILQVPHHGADANWFPGGHQDISNDISIFSYGIPNGNKHPGHATLNDLASKCPIHVTQNSGWHCHSFFM